MKERKKTRQEKREDKNDMTDKRREKHKLIVEKKKKEHQMCGVVGRRGTYVGGGKGKPRIKPLPLYNNFCSGGGGG